MKTVGLIVNTNKDVKLNVTKTVLTWTIENDIEILSIKPLDLEEIKVVDEHTFYKQSEVIIVIGGDGTVLHSFNKISFHNKPMIGINCGTLGYLTNVEQSEVEEALNDVLNVKYKMSKHTLLTTTFENGKINSLNEISIKAKCNKLINLSLYVDNIYIHSFRCDGLILCTPSGSTAYNLSSGGPLIMANAKVFCVTPICPHQLFAKPIIIDDSSEIKIVYENDSNCEVDFISDGEFIKTFDKNFEISLKKADVTLKIINTFERSFYKILLQKLIGVSDKK